MGRRFGMAYDLNNMIPAPAGVAAPQVIYKSEDGILLAFGKTVPADNAVGYAPGCIFIHIDGSGATDLVFVNEGTALLANFDSTHS